MIILYPLVACVMCTVLTLALARPPSAGTDPAVIPNTGGADPVTPTPGSPRALSPGYTYPEAAHTQLATCLSAFHHFVILEETGAHQSGATDSQVWRDQMSRAAQSYRAACQPLGNLPAAPPAYSELEHWLKLAAAEVGPMTDDFQTALDQNHMDAYQAALDHLDKFVEYAKNAEDILSALDQQRNL